MSNQANTFRQVNAPMHAGFYTTNCAICGHEELTRPVYLQNTATGATIAVGTGCAANVLGTTIKMIEAELAADELRNADDLTRAAYTEFSICLPARVSDKFTAKVAARWTPIGTRIGEEAATRAANIYRALHAVGQARAHRSAA